MAAGQSGVNIVFSGDSTKAESAARRVRKAVDDIGSSTKKTAGTLDQIVGQFGKMFLSAAAIQRAIVGAAHAVTSVMDKQAAAGKDVAGVRLRSELAGQRVGLGTGDIQAILGAAGSVTQEQRAAFVERVAGAKGGRDPAAVREAGIAYATGLVSEEEAIAASRSKEAAARLSRIAAERREKLSLRSRIELQTRDIEQALPQLAGSDAESFAQSTIRRRAKAAVEARDIYNPRTAILKDAISSAIPGADAIIGEADTALQYPQQVQRVMREIADETRDRKQINYSGATDQGR
jgi:hypothetical protein